MIIGEIALFSSRVAEMTEFYAKLFGLQPVVAVPGKSVFVLGAVHMMIHDGPSPAPEGPLFDDSGYPPNTDHFAFQVDDLEATCSRLLSEGIKVEVRDFPWGRSGYLLDPDGRRLEIQGPDIKYGY